MEILRQQSRMSARETLLQALEMFSREDFSARLPLCMDGIDAQVMAAFNAAAEANERFAAQARHLDERLRQVERERAEVEHARVAIEEKAGQLELSAYRRAGFLAAMSDDLRTPLNSLLMLAKLLADNDEGNLTAKQVDFAQTIYVAGTDLLSLVDDLLELAKTEPERVAPQIEEQLFQELRDYFLRAFRQLARDKRLTFEVHVAPELPSGMYTDGKRLRQVLRNLLSLAFKFAHGGGVTLAISAAATDVVFEVFHQSDGTIGCEHGTGLGLAICRELGHSLGGEVHVANPCGENVRFALRLPLVGGPARPGVAPSLAAPPGDARSARTHRSPGIDDRAPPAVWTPRPAYHGHKSRCADEAVMLIAEGNAQVASVMLELLRANGYQGVVASDLGTMRVLLREIAPEAILIGGSLMDVDGWTMLELLKRDPETQRLPVSVSYFDTRSYVCLQIGAVTECGEAVAVHALAGLDAAAGRKVARLLAAGLPANGDDDDAWCVDGRRITTAATGAQALDALRDDAIDALVVGPALGDMSAIELVRVISAAGLCTADLPVAIVGASGSSVAPVLGMVEIAVLRHRRKLDDILEETALYLHGSLGRRPSGARGRAPRRREASPELAGRKVLIVDDDIYNIYAMTGALEQQGMRVVLAENGKEGIDALRNNPDTDVVLMDITMPEPDGDAVIAAMRRIAAQEKLPIIAVTPRAMPGDRDKCIDAGASDYISKPVNVEQLLALLRTWLTHGR